MNVPVGVPADQPCGKGVHIDAHLHQAQGDPASDVVDNTYPAVILKCGPRSYRTTRADLSDG